MGIFKAYDIRGVYRDGLDEDLAYRIGRRLPALLGGVERTSNRPVVRNAHL